MLSWCYWSALGTARGLLTPAGTDFRRILGWLDGLAARLAHNELLPSVAWLNGLAARLAHNELLPSIAWLDRLAARLAHNEMLPSIPHASNLVYI